MFAFDELPEFLPGAHRTHFADCVADIGPVETGDEGFRAFKREFGDDLLTCALVRRCGQGDARDAREAFREDFQLAILWPEIVPPLGNAMGLVNGEKRNLMPRHQRQSPLLHEAFGRNIQ